MSYDKVRASKTIIGTKQAVKAMQAGLVKELLWHLMQTIG